MPVKKVSKDDKRAVVDWFCLHLIIMVSLYLNYVYRVSFEGLIKALAHWFISVSDRLGLEVHFVRFLYWTLLDQSI